VAVMIIATETVAHLAKKINSSKTGPDRISAIEI